MELLLGNHCLKYIYTFSFLFLEIIKSFICAYYILVACSVCSLIRVRVYFRGIGIDCEGVAFRGYAWDGLVSDGFS
jgi:hypothetical protein